MKITVFLIMACLTRMSVYAQLMLQRQSGLYLQQGAAMYVQGSVNAYAPVAGKGTFSLSGDSAQSINMRSFSIDNLAVDNKADILMEGNLSIAGSLLLKKGIIKCGNYELALEAPAAIKQIGELSFVETNGSGRIRKKVNGDLTGYLIPVGNSAFYLPVNLSTTGPYANAFVTVASRAGANPNMPSTAQGYLNHFWAIERSGIMGNVSAVALYSDQTEIKGMKKELQGYFWNRTKAEWSPALHSPRHNFIRAEIIGDGGDIFAMKQAAAPFASGQMTLTPNPAVGFTKFRMYSDKAGRGVIDFTDAAGRMVYSMPIQIWPGINEYTIDLKAIPKGYYDVHFRNARQERTFKLIKR